MLNTLLTKIDKSLASFLDTVEKEYKFHLVGRILYDSIREFSLREGKRIRPLLFILSYKGYAPKGKKIPASLYHASTCIEFLHNFMLIHDDIIDRSDLRRGKPTMHRLLQKAVPVADPDRLGKDLAIIAGDIVYALAIDAFLAIKEDPARKERALKYFIQTAAFTAMGEFVDTLHGVNQLKNISEDDVFLNYSLKTARYTFDCPMVTGAILAGASERETRRLAEFGLLIGQAFQIQDDIIGIFETEKAIGKSILSDLAEQKKTLLMVHANKALHGATHRRFMALFLKPSPTLADLDTMRTILVDSKSLAYALDAMRTRTAKADAILKNLHMTDCYKTIIHTALFDLFRHAETVAKAWPIYRSRR
ncbi:MAG: polyprenyl synthetase family protein [Candidatus Omnitrophota bacterium]